MNQARKSELKTIYCIPDTETIVPRNIDVVAYEPVWAIGTNKTETPENAHSVIQTIKNKTGARLVIYGGSVKPDNVSSFIGQPAIDGVFTGGTSLSAASFSQLIAHAINT